MPRLLEETRRQRRKTYVDAAWHTVGAAGLHATTIDDVCRAAGSSKGAFYAHFDSKTGLLIALIRDEAEEERCRLTEMQTSHRLPVPRLRAAVRELIARGDDPCYVRVHADIWGAALTDESVRKEVAAALAMRRATLRAWVQEALDRGDISGVRANALASALLALSDGLLLHGALEPEAFIWRNVGRAIDHLLSAAW